MTATVGKETMLSVKNISNSSILTAMTAFTANSEKIGKTNHAPYKLKAATKYFSKNAVSAVIAIICE